MSLNTLYSADNDGELMVKSSIRFKKAGESLMEIFKSLTSSMYILYIPLGWKMELDKIWDGENGGNSVDPQLFSYSQYLPRRKVE